MKSNILLFITILFFSNNAYAQIYEPVVDTNKMWVVFRSEDHPPYHGKTMAYKISGDSVLIDNEYWHKILESTDSLYTKWSFFDYNGYIREENKIVFLGGGIYEDTLYNFNLGPGDICFFDDNEEYYIIEDTITKYFAGKNRKAQVVNFRSDTIYAGIGSKKGGLLGTMYYSFTGELYTLVCYYENDSLLYHDPDYETCYIDNITSAGEVRSEQEMKVYPNPAGHSVFLRFAGELSQPFDFILYDASGRKVKQTRITGRETEIGLEGLGSGLYYYELQGPVRTTGKIVIK